MAEAEEKPGLPLSRWNWHDVISSLQAASNLAAQVGSLVALLLTPVILLLVAPHLPGRMGDWVCCCLLPFGVLVPLFVGGVGAALAGMVAGMARGMSGHVGPGMVAGGLASGVLITGLYRLWTVYFPQAPPITLWLLAGPALGILAGGMVAPFADPTHPQTAGGGRVPARFRPLRFLGVRWELPRPGEKPTPRTEPGRREEGIQAPQPGVIEKPRDPPKEED